MTNLEIILIYGAVGLMITLIITEIEHSYIEAEDVMRGVTCWLPFSIAIIVLIVYKIIRKIIRDKGGKIMKSNHEIQKIKQ